MINKWFTELEVDLTHFVHIEHAWTKYKKLVVGKMIIWSIIMKKSIVMAVLENPGNNNRPFHRFFP